MPLPFKIVDVNTATWSDYKNSYSAVYAALHAMRNSVSDGSLTLGHNNEYLDLKAELAAGAPYPLLRFCVHADKVGSPTFSVTLNAYADDGSGNPDLNNKIGSGTTISASAFSATARLMLFTFPLPPNIAATLVHYVFKASAQGDASNHLRFYKDSGGSLFNSQGSPNTGIRTFGSSTWTYPGTADILRCAVIFEDNSVVTGGVNFSPVLWAVAVDNPNSKFRIFKSVDIGATWAEVDSGTAPATSSTAGQKTIQVIEGLSATYAPIVSVGTVASGSSLGSSDHEIGPGSTGWGSGPLNITGLTISQDGPGNTPFYYGLRSNRDALACYQGATETVMGAARRRIKVAVVGVNNSVDVVGSANSPIAGTLPGTATHYDHRLSFVDAEDRLHVFWSTSDSNEIQHRVLNADNTFSTVNTIGSTPAVCSNTSAHPIALGCNYYKNNEWRIAILYPDSTSGTIKVAHCKAADSATASSWTIEQISTDTPEVTTCNLGFLSPDALQGSQLIAFYVKSDDTLWMTKDNGTGTWSAPVQWRSGQAVAGISGFSTARNLNFQCLNTAPATDELQFDRL